MKKILSIMLSLSMIVSIAFAMTGCSSAGGASTPTPAASKSPASAAPTDSGKDALVGFCANTNSVAFVSWLANTTKDLLAKDGVKVQIADAALTASTQISQIENFAVMGAKAIVIIPVDPKSLKDSITYAQSKGTKVLVLNSDTGVYDCLMTSDRHEIGVNTAKLAVSWINETFPDAKDGSIEVAIFEDRTNPEASANSDGLHEIAKLSPKVKVVKVVDGVNTNEGGQAAVSTLLQTNPNVRAVLCYNSEGSLGVSEYVMSSGVISDLSKFGTFAADWTDQIGAEIQKSITNKSVYRGSVKFGSDNIPLSIYELVTKMINGKEFPKNQWDPQVGVDSKNLSKYYTKG